MISVMISAHDFPPREAGAKGGFGVGGGSPPDLNDFRPGGRAPAGEAGEQ